MVDTYRRCKFNHAIFKFLNGFDDASAAIASNPVRNLRARFYGVGTTDSDKTAVFEKIHNLVVVHFPE